MKPGVLSQAKGSAFVEFGKTKVMAAVYGPKPTDVRRQYSESGILEVDVKFSPFATVKRGQHPQVLTPAWESYF